ncbi:hypothetical protein [Zobellia russellii]|uniref:hypothetical protein n=1 Tax=Zobellia russellii TaxID=248907 RepID=UPI001BFF2636|nr:hypothetical protein [Zobellia russellii]MBT9188289.1 hypothetical protein [Zobellia russellii]
MGYCENWLKWSFTVDDPKIKNSILPDCDNNEWLEVTKNRLALNIIDNDGQLEIQPLSIDYASGCQVEYTRVQVISETWYTFTLEWFGEEHIDLSDNILSSILGDGKLSLKQSMRYAAFFKKKSITKF